MSSNTSTSAAFQFSASQRGQMLAVLKTIKEIVAPQSQTPNLEYGAWDSRSSKISLSKGPFGRLPGTKDTLIFFGDEPGWLMELDRRERILPNTGAKHIRIDDLHNYRAWDKTATKQLSANVIMPLLRIGFSGKHRIWLITPPNASFDVGQFASVIHSVYTLQNPKLSDQDTFRNVSFEQIELGSGNGRNGEKHYLIGARWILQNMPMIAQWPRYGPRFPQSMWSTSYANLFSGTIRNSPYFTPTLMSLLRRPSAPNIAIASGQSNASNRTDWNETARKARAVAFREDNAGRLPVRGAQRSATKQVQSQGQGSNVLRRI